MAYAEKRDHKLTGHWYGEVVLKVTGERFRRRFETKRGAEGYEAYVHATGEEPATFTDARLAGPTFKETVVLMRATKNPQARLPREPPRTHDHPVHQHQRA